MSPQEISTLDDVLTTLKTGPPAVRKRLCRGVSTLLASADGRYLEQLDLRLSQLEALDDELRKT